MPVVKNPPANAGDIRDVALIPGSGRFPGGGHGNPLQYSCLENPIDRGAWWATVHRAGKSWTQLKQHNMHAQTSGHGSLSPATLLGFHWNLLTHYDISYSYSTTKRFLISLHSQHQWFTEQVVSLAFRAISSVIWTINDLLQNCVC